MEKPGLVVQNSVTDSQINNQQTTTIMMEGVSQIQTPGLVVQNSVTDSQINNQQATTMMIEGVSQIQMPGLVVENSATDSQINNQQATTMMMEEMPGLVVQNSVPDSRINNQQATIMMMEGKPGLVVQTSVTDSQINNQQATTMMKEETPGIVVQNSVTDSQINDEQATTIMMEEQHNQRRNPILWIFWIGFASACLCLILIEFDFGATVGFVGIILILICGSGLLTYWYYMKPKYVNQTKNSQQPFTTPTHSPIIEKLLSNLAQTIVFDTTSVQERPSQLELSRASEVHSVQTAPTITYTPPVAHYPQQSANQEYTLCVDKEQEALGNQGVDSSGDTDNNTPPPYAPPIYAP